jgi:hypothetical protein
MTQDNRSPGYHIQCNPLQPTVTKGSSTGKLLLSTNSSIVLYIIVLILVAEASSSCQPTRASLYSIARIVVAAWEKTRWNANPDQPDNDGDTARSCAADSADMRQISHLSWRWCSPWSITDWSKGHLPPMADNL